MKKQSKIVVTIVSILLITILIIDILYIIKGTIPLWLFALTIAGGLLIYVGGLLTIWYIEDFK